jgi:hypothetical protein
MNGDDTPRILERVLGAPCAGASIRNINSAHDSLSPARLIDQLNPIELSAQMNSMKLLFTINRPNDHPTSSTFSHRAAFPQSPETPSKKQQRAVPLLDATAQCSPSLS